jgi:hypothetical protein
MTDPLAEFLVARAAELAAAARQSLESTLPARFVDADRDSEPLVSLLDADRSLRAVTAVREITSLYADTAGIVARAGERLRAAVQPPAGSVVIGDYLEGKRELAVLRLAACRLAGIWNDHPGYLQEWTP